MVDETQLRNLDLNLLVVLDVLLEERSVSRSAKRLHRSQSATSHALARLREQLGDPVLVRVGGEMRPSPRAAGLQPELRRLLRSLGQLLSSEAEFRPESTRRTFTIVAPDLIAGWLPAIRRSLASEAPGACLEMLAPGPGRIPDLLDGRCDLAIAPSRGVPQRSLRVMRLGEVPWAVFGRADHPFFGDPTRDAWLSWPHITVRTGSREPGRLARALRDEGLERTVALILPSFGMAPPALADSDLLLAVPRWALAPYARPFGLAQAPLPLGLPSLVLGLYSARTREREPALAWIHERVNAAFADHD